MTPGNDYHVDPVTPAPSPAPAPTAIDAAKLQQMLALFLELGDAVAKITPTTVDDKVMEFLHKFLGEPWFTSLLLSLLSIIRKGQAPNETELKAAFARYAKEVGK
jgi:hypothetical protein